MPTSMFMLYIIPIRWVRWELTNEQPHKTVQTNKMYILHLVHRDIADTKCSAQLCFFSSSFSFFVALRCRRCMCELFLFVHVSSVWLWGERDICMLWVLCAVCILFQLRCVWNGTECDAKATPSLGTFCLVQTCSIHSKPRIRTFYRSRAIFEYLIFTSLLCVCVCSCLYVFIFIFKCVASRVWFLPLVLYSNWISRVFFFARCMLLLPLRSHFVLDYLYTLQGLDTHTEIMLCASFFRSISSNFCSQSIPVIFILLALHSKLIPSILFLFSSALFKST